MIMLVPLIFGEMKTTDYQFSLPHLVIANAEASESNSFPRHFAFWPSYTNVSVYSYAWRTGKNRAANFT